MITSIDAVKIERDQRWTRNHDGQEVRVMGEIDSYVMYRVKGCAATCQHRRWFLRAFTQAH